MAFADLSEADTLVVANFLRDGAFVQYLDLRGNSIGPDGIKTIAGALKRNRSISGLSLKWNPFGKDPAGVRGLCEMLRSNLTISYLDLQGCGLDSAGAELLAGMLAENRTIKFLDLSWNPLGVAGGVSIVEGLKRAEHIMDVQLGGTRAGAEILHEITFLLRRNRRKAAKDASERAELEAQAAEEKKKPKVEEESEDQKTARKRREKQKEEEVLPLPRTWTREEFNAMQRRMLKMDREEKRPQERQVFEEINAFSDKTLAETSRHRGKTGEVDQRERLATEAYEEREQRYTREIRQIEFTLKDAIDTKDGIQKDVNWKEGEVKRLEGEHALIFKEMAAIKEAAAKTEVALREQLLDVAQEQADRRHNICLLEEDLQAMEEENESLRKYVVQFKANVENVLG